MDMRLLKMVKSARKSANSGDRESVTDDLTETILQVGGAPVGIRDARNGLTGIIERVREGRPQFVGKRNNLAVIISVDDLAELVREAARPLTFGEELDAMGVEPYKGPRIIMRKGRDRTPLKRTAPAEQSVNS